MPPPVVYNSETLNLALELPAEERRRTVTKIAVQQGLSGAAKVAAVWIPAVTYLRYGNSGVSRWFNTGLNVSGKTAVVIMPILLGFGIISEQVATRLANPQAFAADLSTGRVSALAPHQRMANYLYDNPMKTLVMLGTPTVLTIFLSKGGQTELTLSQRLMQTRVLGQFSVLAILIGTLGFHDYMAKRGRFLEPWEEELLQKQKETASLAVAKEKLDH